MNDYMITVIGSAVLSAIALMLSPDKWRKYVKAVTGIMIISVIISPVAALRGIDLFSGYEYSDAIDENAQKTAVREELEKRVAQDAAEKLSAEFGITAKVSVKLKVNENYEIEGVEEITVWTEKQAERIRQRLNEIYSPQKISFRK